MVIFKDRQAAGSLLAVRLSKLNLDLKNSIVLGIPRGGVVPAYEIALKLNLPLGVVLSRKIGSPSQKEFSVGAVDPSGQVYWQYNLLERLNLKPEDLQSEVEAQYAEIKRRELEYKVAEVSLEVDGKTVVLVDDGIATGATVFASVEYLKKCKAEKIIIATPVIEREIYEKFLKQVDQVIALHIAENLKSVSSYFQNFSEVSDEEVVSLLKEKKNMLLP